MVLRGVIREAYMKVAILACTLALSLSACATREQNGALIGGATGATIGAVASNSVGGALVGGAVGAVAGATIASATAPHYYRSGYYNHGYYNRGYYRHCWWNGYGQRVCR
jgi:hypothetical protein